MYKNAHRVSIQAPKLPQSAGPGAQHLHHSWAITGPREVADKGTGGLVASRAEAQPSTDLPAFTVAHTAARNNLEYPKIGYPAIIRHPGH